jgi:chromosome segregation ATPase
MSEANTPKRHDGSNPPALHAQVISLDRRFDPTSSEAEARYDRVARRINQLRATRNRVQRHADELARQFVDGDLVARTGRRRGAPLTTAGRRQRMRSLLELTAEIALLDAELAGLDESLSNMNQALDAWARQTYGV